MPDTKYHFKLIHEEVAQNDTFKYGTHKKIADAMYRLITSEEKSATIGLEGCWGSGKSTVVQLLAQKLKENNDTLLYSFDAWAHEGDPLRRIFLEGLIDTIAESPDILKDKSNWEKDKHLSGSNKDNKYWLESKKEKIQARKKTTRIHTNHQTTRYAKWLTIAALFVPAGAAFLSRVNYDLLSFPKGTPFWLFIFGILFTFAPLSVVGLWALGCKFKWTKLVGENPNFSLVASEADRKTVQNITEDSERSSIEFENYFREIAEEVFKKGFFERFIIVIDNLDRIEKTDALKVWSTLQTFFQYRSCISQNNDWRRKIWFVVPYDRFGLSEIWGIKKATLNEEQIADSENSVETSPVAHSFLNKCFQVRFEVPSPVMSSWQEFFEDNMNSALSDWPEEERRVISNTYQSCNSTLEKSPTPREIRNFINQVGITGLSWGGKMSAEAIALYCHLRYKYGECELRIMLLKEHGIPDSIFVKGEVQTLIKELSGLLFGVNKETGMELLLNEPIKLALKNGDSEEINQLQQKFGSAFKIAWKAGESQFRPSKTSVYQELLINYTKAIIPLGKISVFEHEFTYLEEYWISSTTERWDLDNFDYATVFNEIHELFSENFPEWLKEQFEFHINIYIERFISKQGSVTDNAFIQITNLEKLLQKLKLSLTPYINNKFTADHWTRWLAISKRLDLLPKSIWPSDEIIKNIALVIQPNATPIPATVCDSLIQAYRLSPSRDVWKYVSNTLNLWLVTIQRVGEDNLYELALEFATNSNSVVKNPIINAVKHQNFWESLHTQNLDGTRIYDITSLALLAFSKNLQESPLIKPSVKDFWKQHELTEEHEIVFDFLMEKGQQQILWESAIGQDNKAIIELISKNLNIDIIWDVDFDTPLLLFNQGFFNVEEIEEHRTIASEYLERFDTGELLKIEDYMSYDYGFWNLVETGTGKGTEFGNLICNRLTRSDWDDSFKKNNFILNIAISDNIVFNRHLYSESFVDFVIKQLTLNCDADEWIWDRFEEIFAKVLDRKLNSEKIIKAFIENKDDTTTLKAFQAIKSLEFSKFDVTVENDTLVKISSWMDSEDDGKLDWAMEKFNLVAPKENFPSDVFKARLKSIISDTQNKCNEIGIRLSEHLGIKFDTNSNIETPD
ncbi:KAP family NTPase [Myxococcota bacterium]|nr:KAP family NTPase [Myxococcota bacterium]MBU1380450.1 KAP family NTPase [Myxococcota bacterium]MBU1497457.1 KAP family NTPase [Myxococcota bacterium]